MLLNFLSFSFRKKKKEKVKKLLGGFVMLFGLSFKCCLMVFDSFSGLSLQWLNLWIASRTWKRSLVLT